MSAVPLGDPNRFVLPDCEDCGSPAAGWWDGRRGWFEPVHTPENTDLCARCAVAAGWYDDWDGDAA